MSDTSVFVSYAHDDKPIGPVLASHIRGTGRRVWIDEGELRVCRLGEAHGFLLRTLAAVHAPSLLLARAASLVGDEVRPFALTFAAYAVDPSPAGREGRRHLGLCWV